MFRRTFLAGLAGIAMAAVATIPAQAHPIPTQDDQWVMLGQQGVGLNPDKDIFYVGTDEGRYEALRFRVLGNRVAFAEVRVFYGNGTSEVLDVKEHVQPGETTPAFDLKGQHRVIERIEMLYQSEIPWAGMAKVQVFGLKSAGYDPGNDWTVLGTKDVNLVVDHDAIYVGPGSGKFRSIRFHVTDRPIHLYDIRVTFGNGQVETYNFNRHIPAGTYSPSLDLAGTYRMIERIDLVYRTESFGGHAKMTVYGQH
jgi:hypothetical protein